MHSWLLQRVKRGGVTIGCSTEPTLTFHLEFYKPRVIRTKIAIPVNNTYSDVSQRPVGIGIGSQLGLR